MLSKAKKQFLMVLLMPLSLACNSDGQHPEKAIDSTATVLENKQSLLQLASETDTTCGMPVTAAAVDTVVLNGKVYGFCSLGCKDAFITILKKEHKR